MNKFKFASIMLTILLVPCQVFAGKVDGSAPALCAVIEAVECGISGDCYGGTAENVNLAQFLRIHFKEKKIKAQRGTENISSDIKTFEKTDSKLIMQGIESGRAWGIVIAQDTGKMSATISTDDGGFIVFGACTPL